MNFNYSVLIGELEAEQKIRFYENLAFNLTLSARGVWSDENLSDAQKVEAMKWLNEILQRIITKTSGLRVDRNESSENDTWEIIKHWASMSSVAENYVEWAVSFSYKTVSITDDASLGLKS